MVIFIQFCRFLYYPSSMIGDIYTILSFFKLSSCKIEDFYTILSFFKLSQYKIGGFFFLEIDLIKLKL
jgi:hypothetical protein